MDQSIRGATRRIWLSLAATGWLLAGSTELAACPFCPPAGSTFAQDRDGAAIVLLGELVSTDQEAWHLRVRQVLKGRSPTSGQSTWAMPSAQAAGAPDAKPGSLWLVLGRHDAADGGPPTASTSSSSTISWSTVAVNETSYLYFARSPSLRIAVPERLRYFARYLEHPDAAIAEDAWREFAHARYDDVAQAAEAFDMAALRRWLADPAVPQTRHGFYGLALGLARDATQRAANLEALGRLVAAQPGGPAGQDFRAGFDGVLGGYLILAGEPGLELVERLFLSNPTAAEGDRRHALVALRFYYEFGRDIPPQRLGQALVRLLDSPALAATAIVDLGRWQSWEALAMVVAAYDREDYPQPATRRAVVGYLTACPQPRAAAALARLRQQDPRGVAEAQAYLDRFGGPSASAPGSASAE